MWQKLSYVATRQRHIKSCQNINMIGFNNGKFAAFSAILTSFSFIEVDPELFQIEESAIFNQNSKFVFDYLTDSHHIPEVYIN